MRILVRLVQVLHAHTYTRKAPHKYDLEQRLNDSATSTASSEHHTFYAHIPPRQEVCLSEWHVPTESSSKLPSSESGKLSASPGASTYTTGTTTSTNSGIVATRTKSGSFSANNSNSEANLNTPLNLLNHAVWDGGSNTGKNSQGMSSDHSSRS